MREQEQKGRWRMKPLQRMQRVGFGWQAVVAAAVVAVAWVQAGDRVPSSSSSLASKVEFAASCVRSTDTRLRVPVVHILVHLLVGAVVGSAPAVGLMADERRSRGRDGTVEEEWPADDATPVVGVDGDTAMYCSIPV